MAHAGYGSNDTGEYDDPDVFTGYVTKRGHMVRNWKRRFFYINGRNRKLYYYVNSGEYRANVRPLGEHTVTTLAHWPDKTFGMEFVCNGGKVFFACAESQEGLNKIFHALARTVAVGHDQNLWGVPPLQPDPSDDETEEIQVVDLVTIIQQRIRTWLACWRLYNTIFQNYPRAMQLRACIVMKRGSAPAKILVSASLVLVSRDSQQWTNLSTAEAYMSISAPQHGQRANGTKHPPSMNGTKHPPSWWKRKPVDPQREIEYSADLLIPFVQLTKVREDLKIVLTFFDGTNGKELGQSVLASLYAHHWKSGSASHNLLSVGGSGMFGAAGSVNFEPPPGLLRTSLIDEAVQRKRTYEFTAASLADNSADESQKTSAPSLLRLLGLNVNKLGCIGSCPTISAFANVSLDSGTVNGDFDDAFTDAISPATIKQRGGQPQSLETGLSLANATAHRFANGGLGMELARCTEENAAGFFRVKKLHPGGQAAQNGLAEGDVIVGVNGLPTQRLLQGTDGNAHDFIAAVTEQPRPLVLNVCSQQGQQQPPLQLPQPPQQVAARRIAHARSRVALHFFPAELGSSMSGPLLCCTYHSGSQGRRYDGRRQWELVTCAIVGGKLLVYREHPLLSVPTMPHLELCPSQIKRVLCPVVRDRPSARSGSNSVPPQRLSAQQRAIYFGTMQLHDPEEPEFIVRFVAKQPRVSLRISSASRRQGGAEHHVNTELGFKLPEVTWGVGNRSGDSSAAEVQRQRVRTKWALAFNALIDSP
jgi:hypothetical protein